MVSPAETGDLAEAFLSDTLTRQGVGRDTLTCTRTGPRR